MTHPAPMRLAGGFVGGRWNHDRAERWERFAPYDLSMPVFVGTDGIALIDAAVEQARRAQRGWRIRSLEERIAVIDKFNERLGEHSPKLALQIMRETGKIAIDAASEMKGVLDRWSHTKAIARTEAPETLTALWKQRFRCSGSADPAGDSRQTRALQMAVLKSRVYQRHAMQRAACERAAVLNLNLPACRLR